MSATAWRDLPPDTDVDAVSRQQRFQAGDISLIAEFIANVAQINNGAMQQIGNFMAAQTPAYRARVIERLSSLIGSIADHDATE